MPEHWSHNVEYVALALMIGAGATLCFGLLATWWRRRYGLRVGRRYCPGPRGRMRSVLAPSWWLRRGRCGYDLTGHLLRGSRMATCDIRCPECGRRLRSLAALLARPWHARYVRPAGALVVLSGAVALAHPVIQIRLTRRLPTDVLILAERMLGDHAPAVVRRPLRWRLHDGDFKPRQSRAMIHLLVRDLRDDNRHFSALNASRALRRIGEDAAIPLQAALESRDWQQRQFAAYTLRSMNADAPSLVMIRVAIEGLRHDRLPRDPTPRRWSGICNANAGVDWLIPHAELAEADLRRAMVSDDPQLRLLSAGILAFAGRTSCVDAAMPILLPHLRDNDTRRDAVFAAAAIPEFGVAALPHLEPWLESDDDQQRGVVQFLWAKLDATRRDDAPAPRYAPPDGTRITTLEHDPTRRWRWRRTPSIEPQQVASGVP